MDAPRLPWLRIASVAVAVAGLVLLRTLVWPDVDGSDVRGFVARSGGWAPALLLLGFVLGTVALLPVTLFNLAAGALFPLDEALVWAYAGTLLAAQAQFWLAHTVGPGLRHAMDRRLPRAVSHLQDRRLIVLLTLRIVPVFPFAPTNYALGLSRVQWRDYSVTGAVGHIPGTVVAVLVGAALVGDLGSLRFWALAGGLAVAALGVLAGATVLWRRYGRREWVSDDG